MFLPIALFLPLALSTPTVTVEDSLVGKATPEFSVEGCLDEPRLFESGALLGEVILLKFWGTT